MYESPLLAAHQRVLDRLHAHRRENARHAEDIRGDGADRSGASAEVILETVPWGVVGEDSTPACEIVVDYGELEGEYAALRRGIAVFDRSDRAVIDLRGSDAVDLLNRLVTNKVGDREAVVAGFILARTGRISADLRIVVMKDRVLVELDRTDVAEVLNRLEGFIFAEDVQFHDLVETHHRIDCLGPDAPTSVEHLLGIAVPGGGAVEVEVDGTLVVAFALEAGGESCIGEPGIGLLAERDAIESIWERLIASPAPGRRPARAIGWNAYNIARIENGRPFFHLDFGPDALPHETGLIPRRVDFRKGCYPGQEIVARMESRGGGRGRRGVVGIRPDADGLPVAGAQVFDAERGIESQVGVVTSSTVSPLRGAVPIAFATVRASHMDPGSRVLVNADGQTVPATVTGLDFEVPKDDAEA